MRRKYRSRIISVVDRKLSSESAGSWKSSQRSHLLSIYFIVGQSIVPILVWFVSGIYSETQYEN